jgi:hypothetical protein
MHRFWCSVRETEIRSEGRENGVNGVSESEAIQQFISRHPELASDPNALNELARRLRHYHRSRNGEGTTATEQQQQQRRRPRSRANTLPAGAVNPLSPEAATFLLQRPTFNEDEDADEDEVEDQVGDNAVEIAGDAPEGLLRMADVEGMRLDGA